MARVLFCNASEERNPILDVALSERNLIVLLSKLYTPGSMCEFLCHDIPEVFAYARLRVEPDEYHYASPTREGAPPGPMHPIAELVHDAVTSLLSELRANAYGTLVDDGPSRGQGRTTPGGELGCASPVWLARVPWGTGMSSAPGKTDAFAPLMGGRRGVTDIGVLSSQLKAAERRELADVNARV